MTLIVSGQLKVICAAVSHNSLLCLRCVNVCAISSRQYTCLITRRWILFLFHCIGVWQCQLRVPNQCSHNVTWGLCKHCCSGEGQRTRSAAAAVRMSSSWKQLWPQRKRRFRLTSRMNFAPRSLALSSPQRSAGMLSHVMLPFYSPIGQLLHVFLWHGMAWTYS